MMRALRFTGLGVAWLGLALMFPGLLVTNGGLTIVDAAEDRIRKNHFRKSKWAK